MNLAELPLRKKKLMLTFYCLVNEFLWLQSIVSKVSMVHLLISSYPCLEFEMMIIWVRKKLNCSLASRASKNLALKVSGPFVETSCVFQCIENIINAEMWA